jgi:hypothetical protein
MGDEIKRIANDEGWSDSTLINVLLGVLSELSEHVEDGLIVGMVKDRAHG